ncbi:NAD-binding protein [Photorhabdus heterorhabditis]|uniref:NAD-binding protein n=1 Tax=Photorhabdus heterorhabditis TaxID=880156 RepID=UPI00245903C7|nr:NAD-binding protein [Photorhabdus heterorhabditis]
MHSSIPKKLITAYSPFRGRSRTFAKVRVERSETTSSVDIFVKDLGLVLETGKALRFPLPLSATAHQMFLAATNEGFGQWDDSAVIKTFKGITLPEKEL